MWDHMRNGELCLFMTDPNASTESGLAIMEKRALNYHTLEDG